MTPQELSERLLDFTARVGKVVDALPEKRMARHIASQLVRCCSAPGPMYEEACAAESPVDFIHKISIALKELRETRCWIRLIIKMNLLAKERLTNLLDEAEQLCRILGQSIVTAKENIKHRRRKSNG